MSDVFISYSHSNHEWLNKLQTFIRPYTRSGSIEVWDDTTIEPGAKWKEEITNALLSAKAAVMLVTPEFLASDFIAEEELPPLLQRAENGGVAIFWIAVSHSAYETTPIKDYQCVNDPAQPLDSLDKSEQDKTLVRICRQIAKSFGGEGIGLTTNDETDDDDFLLDYHLNRVKDALNDDARDAAKSELLEASELSDDITPLLEALNDRDWVARAAIADVLGELRQSEAVPKLIDLLRDDASFVRSVSSEALGKIGDDGAVPELIRTLYDLDPAVRGSASGALGLIGHSDAVSELIMVLDDEAASVRMRTVEALGRIKDSKALESAVEPLVALLSDTTKPYGISPICQYAAQTLVFIGTPEALKAAREWRRENPRPDMELFY